MKATIRESSRYPLQVALWDILDRTLIRKEWGFHLGVDVSEISRWSNGVRAMSLDEIVHCARICERQGKVRAAAEVRSLLVSAFELDLEDDDHGIPSPVDVALSSGQAAGMTAEAIRDGLQDGALDAQDAPKLREAARQHRGVAEQLDLLALMSSGPRLRAVGGR